MVGFLKLSYRNEWHFGGAWEETHAITDYSEIFTPYTTWGQGCISVEIQISIDNQVKHQGVDIRSSTPKLIQKSFINHKIPKKCEKVACKKINGNEKITNKIKLKSLL